MKVLLVDDDELLAEDLKLLLPREIDLAWAPDSERAVELLRCEDPPEAIILDLCMPARLADIDENEGITLLEALRSELAVDVPVIVMTSTPRERMERICIEKGAKVYLEKPVGTDRLAKQLTALTK